MLFRIKNVRRCCDSCIHCSGDVCQSIDIDKFEPNECPYYE